MSDRDLVGANRYELTASAVLTGSQTAFEDRPEPHYNHVWFWHFCGSTNTHTGKPLGWGPSGLPAHEVTGTVEAGDLTVQPSILCMSCGKHGFLTAMVWSDC